MPPSTVTVHLAIGSPVTGGWCPTCLLPSLIRVPIWQLSARGMDLLRIVEACQDHNGVRFLPPKPELLRFEP